MGRTPIKFIRPDEFHSSYYTPLLSLLLSFLWTVYFLFVCQFNYSLFESPKIYRRSRINNRHDPNQLNDDEWRRLSVARTDMGDDMMLPGGQETASPAKQEEGGRVKRRVVVKCPKRCQKPVRHSDPTKCARLFSSVARSVGRSVGRSVAVTVCPSVRRRRKK